jgi:hypothetical protein
MSLFDKTNQNATAFQNSAPFFPATLGETMGSVYDEIRGNENSDSFARMEYDMFERYRDQVEELTGDRLYNPLTFMPRGEQPGRVSRFREQFFSDIANLREKHPNMPELSETRLAEDMLKERQKFRDQRAEVAGRESGFASGVAAFAGGTAAFFTDPITLASMAVGAPAATTVLRAAAIEGAIGLGSETVIQAGIQATRDRIGEGADYGEALTNILLAGAGGGLFAGAIRGGMAGTKALLRRTRELPAAQRTPEVKSAEAYLNRKVEMEANNPFGPSIKGQMEHAKRLDNALLNLTRPTRELLQDGTGVARVLPHDTASEVPVTKVVETLDQHAARIRADSPDLFREIDVNTQALSDMDARMVQVTDELAATPKGNKAGAEELAKLRKQRAKTTDKRKQARLDRKIEKLESDPEIQAAFKRSTLTQEKADLDVEAKELKKGSKSLQKDVRKVAKKSPRRAEHTAAPTRATMSTLDMDKTERAWANLMIDIGETAGRNADAVGPLASDAPIRQAPDVLDVDPEIEKAVKDDAFVDGTLRASADNTPERVHIVEDDNGNLVERTAKQILDDHADETTMLSQLGDCIKGNPV